MYLLPESVLQKMPNYLRKRNFRVRWVTFDFIFGDASTFLDIWWQNTPFGVESFKYVLSHEPVVQIRNKWTVIFTVECSVVIFD